MLVGLFSTHVMWLGWVGTFSIPQSRAGSTKPYNSINASSRQLDDLLDISVNIFLNYFEFLVSQKWWRDIVSIIWYFYWMSVAQLIISFAGIPITIFSVIQMIIENPIWNCNLSNFFFFFLPLNGLCKINLLALHRITMLPTIFT